jgi:hypothetical protein
VRHEDIWSRGTGKISTVIVSVTSFHLHGENHLSCSRMTLFSSCCILLSFRTTTGDETSGNRCRSNHKSRSTVIAITARSALEVTICSMGGDDLSPKRLCPSCGRLMGLTRTIAASSGYGELHTYGCRECGVWVTEGSSPRDQLKDTLCAQMA